MDKQRFVRLKLSEKFDQIRGRNSLFSARSFARQLGISASTYCEFMSGKRFLSQELLERIINLDSLDPNEKKEYQALPLKADKGLYRALNFDEVLNFFKSLETVQGDVYQNICECHELSTSLDGKQLSDKNLYIFADQNSLFAIQEAMDSFVSEIAKIIDSQNPDIPKVVVGLNLNMQENV